MFSFRAVPKLRHLGFPFGILLFIGVSDRLLIPRTRDEMIREAITEKKLLAFDYNDHRRIVEPHVYGRKSDKNGIMAYQIDGQSSKGGLPNWRRMYMNKMTNMKVLDEAFSGMRPVPNEHSSWDFIYLIVDKQEENSA